MSSAVAELESGLMAMLQLKPPGVTGSRINSLTALCKANVQSESVLIQKLYTHFKKAPGTHKLGVLYVVDSVVREWVVQARAAGQTINSAAADGTFAAGVHRVKELLPVLMNDIIQSAPHDHKEKIKKLLDIWEKGQTFPLQMLNSFKEKLGASTVMQSSKDASMYGLKYNLIAPDSSIDQSTTPDGSPPPDLQKRLGLQPRAEATPAPTPAAVPSILEALANIARQNTSASSVVPSNQAQGASQNVSNAQNNPAQHAGALNPLPAYSQYPPPVNANYTSQMAYDVAQPPTSNQANAWLPASNLVAPPTAPAVLDSSTAMLIQILAERGLNPDQISDIVNGKNGLPPAAVAAAPSQFPFQNAGQNATPNGQNGQNGHEMRYPDSRDHAGHYEREPMRSPRLRRRSRSPSPSRIWNARNSPTSRRREELGHDYGRGRDSLDRDRDDERVGGGRGRGNEYRQRSPARRGHSPPRNWDSYSSGHKWIEYDRSLPAGHIKVLSRTLFVGGVNSSESELRKVFSKLGTVQTCIVNKEKRHAFVKMVSRQDAVIAKEAMENYKPMDSQTKGRTFNQTKWGVGFGPRDCSDYTTGISVVPIARLTDADRKWIVSAEYGGTGGKPIEPYMVVEEPDIEIGQGVSSKAISRRMQGDRGSDRGGSKFGRDRTDDYEGSRGRRSQDRDERWDGRRRDDDDSREKPNDAASAVSSYPMPIYPGFQGGIPGYPMPTMPNGMAMFPNFPFANFGQPPAPGQGQPPPPGRD
ncbi:RNA-binding protein [Phlyctema vagabunda]|uniref:RNA-binding protein n=1 Tax=Phlyctema vagabunda TaxID=108571 RepID=A0ABR4P300_9HELO